MPVWFRYAIGIVVAIHGYVYIPFAFYLVNEFQRAHGASWLLGSVLGTSGLRTTTLMVHVAAGVLLLACGLLLVFAAGAVPAWRALAVAGGGVGVLAFLITWNGHISRLSEQGVLGAAASLAVLIAAIAAVP